MSLSDLLLSRMQRMKNAVKSTLDGTPALLHSSADRKLFYKAAKSLNLAAVVRKSPQGGWFACAIKRQN